MSTVLVQSIFGQVVKKMGAIWGQNFFALKLFLVCSNTIHPLSPNFWTDSYKYKCSWYVHKTIGCGDSQNIYQKICPFLTFWEIAEEVTKANKVLIAELRIQRHAAPHAIPLLWPCCLCKSKPIWRRQNLPQTSFWNMWPGLNWEAGKASVSKLSWSIWSSLCYTLKSEDMFYHHYQRWWWYN